MSEPFIRFEGVTKSFGSLTVVNELDLSIQKGEFVSMLGPSGSGKTTILMMLAGFEKPTHGSVWLAGKRIDQLPPHKRAMGVVFQNYALFPHMTVQQNVGFPLRMRGLNSAEAAERVKRALAMVQLGSYADRRPSQLSGGQQQRVALARALVFEPEVVLMDEPLGALDKQLREQMQLDIRDLHRRLGLTIVFVTHDQTEALTMSDRISVFNQGKIEQIGTPSELYDHPRTRFVAEFIGETNLVRGTVTRSESGSGTVQLSPGRDIAFQTDHPVVPGKEVFLSIRPERIRVASGAATANRFEARVEDIVYHGDHLRLMVSDGGQRFVIKSDRTAVRLAPGDTIDLAFNAEDCWVVEP